MRYAQEKHGRKLHLVDDVNGGVMRQALCGRVAEKGWRMTINVPMGMACRNCVRVARAANPTPRTYVVV
jgi:hypothetical protein